MDDTLRNALKRKRELESELEKVNQFIAMYEVFSGTKIVRDEMVSPVENAEEKPTLRLRRRIRPVSSPEKIAEVAAQVIRESGTPIQRGDMVNRLEERGIRFNSEDKARYVGTILWRHKALFTNIEGRGYWLSELGEPDQED